MSAEADFRAAAAERILVFDGGYGTAIQKFRLEEADYRGEAYPLSGTGKAHIAEFSPNHPLMSLDMTTAVLSGCKPAETAAVRREQVAIRV